MRTTATVLDAPSPARGTAGRLVPGIALACAGAVVGILVHLLNPIASPLLVAIVVGALLANLVQLPNVVLPGLQLSGKRLLRAGIVLLGLQLSVGTVLGLGAGMIAVVVVVVGVGVVTIYAIGRLLGLGESHSLLIACGFSICGAAAVAAADGVVDAEEEEVATSVALVVLFGTVMIPLVPFTADLLGLSSRTAGLWAGASVHEVAQVVATAGAIGGGALSVAVIVKLARVLMLAPVMATLSWRRRRALGRAIGRDAATSCATGQVRMPPLVPLFVIGFIAMIAVRSVLPVPGVLLDGAAHVETFLLAAAMFALGCGVRVQSLRAVGPRPFVLALAGTLIVSVVALAGVALTACG